MRLQVVRSRPLGLGIAVVALLLTFVSICASSSSTFGTLDQGPLESRLNLAVCDRSSECRQRRRLLSIRFFAVRRRATYQCSHLPCRRRATLSISSCLSPQSDVEHPVNSACACSVVEDDLPAPIQIGFQRRESDELSGFTSSKNKDLILRALRTEDAPR